MVAVRVVMGVMKIVVGVACLAFLVLVTDGNNSHCKPFSELKLGNGISMNYSCPLEECTTGKVVGTIKYFGGSDICLAALHAGVITRLGTNITITRHKPNKGKFKVFGTSQNRIVSKTKEREAPPFFEVENLLQESGTVDEVLMVYDDGSESVVRFTCFSQDQESNISADNLKSWDYNNIEINIRSGNYSPKLVFDVTKESNLYGVRLLGSQRDKDVLAVVQYPKDQYQSGVATLRASLRDNITLRLLPRTPSLNEVEFKRLPDKGWSKGRLLRITSANSTHTGIYILRNEKDETQWVNMDWMIRGCEKDFYGPKCKNKCPQCLNGGQCHSRLGTCVCAPGFIGSTCQYACPAGWFGNECQFSCSQVLRGTQVGEEEERERSCRGLTICQPYPYGCSCAAGFSNYQHNQTCSKECSPGYYGADCEQECQNCDNNKCHPDSGTCIHGCQGGSNCRKVMASPDVRLTPLRRGFSATWNASTDNDTYYFISHELLHRLDCRVNDTEMLHQQNLTTLEYNATALLQHATYNVCVVASSPKGRSLPSCSKVDTLPEAPSVNITNLNCVDDGETLTCFVTLSGGCENYNGPNATVTFTLHAKLACSHLLTTLSDNIKLSDTRANASFPNYLHGETYQVTAEVGNNNETGDRRNFNFTTKPRKPPPIVNVTHISLSDSAVQLKWNDPCPSHGKIKKWRFARNETGENGWLELQSCDTTASNRCYNITGLKPGNVYNYKIEQKNDGGTDYGYNYTFKVEEKEPGSPNVTTAGKGDQQLNLTLELPSYHGGTLRNCCISLTASKKKCNNNLNLDSSTLNFMFDGLEKGKKYETEAYCCNNKFCSKHWKQPVATLPLPISLPAAPSILKKTNSTVTLRLPVITHNQGGNMSLVVFVCHKSQHQNCNLTEEIKRLFETQQRQTRKKRLSPLGEDQCKTQMVWIAAKLNEGGREFVVGDGKIHGGFLNCPLKLGQTYIIGLMGVNELLGGLEYSFVMVDGGVVVEPPNTYDPLLLLLLLLLIFPLFGLLAYLCYSRQPLSKDCDQKITADHALQDMTQTMGHLVTTNERTTKEDEIKNEPIYGNLNPQGSPATTSQVPYEEVEAYLNKMIGSKEIGEDFRTVPGTLNKSMVVALFPEHRGKNRYRNNLPYDDTRVVLSKLDGDMSSDYINANHVPGYGNMRYIATQGPKNAKVCTIADFWRMVVEQQVTVIIMVANFVENGKRKVAEYYTPGQTLNFSGFEVVVDHQEQLPHFTVSSISVKWKDEVRQVQHYHYQKWPDHGIPFEAYSIAQMLIHFQSYHSEGGTIVHCSAGIGRTGTVLQVLMMCEMLNLKSYLSPLEVLGRLRMSRARLVENEAQYNLSLEILEEVLFGKKTNVSTDYLSNHLHECVLSCRTQYAKAKALPSPLTYTTSNLPIFQPLNRNPSILPADSSRFYLQPKAGLNAELSQYINAIRVPFLDKQKFILATEHPLPDTVSNFWRLVVETECTLIIFINSLEDQKEGEFPTMLHDPKEMWQVGDYQLQVEQTQQYGVWLRHSTLTITSKKDGGMQHVHVYQSIHWPLSSSLPPSPLLLLTVTELLQVPQSAKAGPPVLCCGDGVTGCGLVAGMAMIIKHLQEEQVVDVYRMVVKLQRARQQFIVSQEQFSMLYTGAAMYLQEFSNYGNFQ